MADSPSYDGGLVGTESGVGGRRRWSWKRLAFLLLGALLTFSVGLAGTIGVLIWRGERSLGRTNINMPSGADGGDTTGAGNGEEQDGQPGQPAPTPAPTLEGYDEILNVLVVGSDSREGLGEENRDLTGGDFEGIRTDTIMLVRVDPRRQSVTALSFPRDMRVPICGHAPDKITHAYYAGQTTGVGGPACLVQTVTDFTGISVDHYVQVDFAGFIELVDELGGVRMYLEEPMSDRKAHLDVEAGCQTLDGREALGFVRTRTDNDFGRIARQQRFLHELIEEVTQAGTLLNVPQLYGLIDVAAQAVTVDDDMSLTVMRQLAVSLRGLRSNDLVTATVPTVTDTSSGIWYEIPVEEEARELFDAFNRGELSAGDAFTSEDPVEPSLPETEITPPDVTAADVPPLSVLNAGGVAGLAGDTAEALRAGGFQVVEIGNAERSDRTATMVRYPAGQRPAAEFLADILDADTELAAELSGVLEVHLGSGTEPAALEVPTPPPATPEASDPEPTAEESEFKNAQAPQDVDC